VCAWAAVSCGQHHPVSQFDLEYLGQLAADDDVAVGISLKICALDQGVIDLGEMLLGFRLNSHEGYSADVCRRRDHGEGHGTERKFVQHRFTSKSGHGLVEVIDRLVDLKRLTESFGMNLALAKIGGGAGPNHVFFHADYQSVGPDE